MARIGIHQNWNENITQKGRRDTDFAGRHNKIFLSAFILCLVFACLIRVEFSMYVCMLKVCQKRDEPFCSLCLIASDDFIYAPAHPANTEGGAKTQ
jgi:hypothetical protein